MAEASSPSVLRQRAAQREHALAMRPHRQMAVAIFRQARRTARSRRARDSRAYRSPRSAGGLAARPARARRTGGRSHGRCSSQEASCCSAVGASTFCQVTCVDRGGAGQIDGGLVVADDGEEIAGAHEFDRALGGALDRRLVDLVDGGAAVGLAHHARMHHAGELHVVDEDGLAENLVRQVEALAAVADVLQVGDRLARARCRSP